jgi:hypothetical protein
LSNYCTYFAFIFASSSANIFKIQLNDSPCFITDDCAIHCSDTIVLFQFQQNDEDILIFLENIDVLQYHIPSHNLTILFNLNYYKYRITMSKRFFGMFLVHYFQTGILNIINCKNSTYQLTKEFSDSLLTNGGDIITSAVFNSSETKIYGINFHILFIWDFHSSFHVQFIQKDSETTTLVEIKANPNNDKLLCALSNSLGCMIWDMEKLSAIVSINNISQFQHPFVFNWVNEETLIFSDTDG